MDSVNATTSVLDPARPATTANSFADLNSEDFFKLLVTQITNQDPLEPTSNEEMLQQISSIRNIELSTTLTDSLRALTGQQHFASASSLIGQYVTGPAAAGGEPIAGMVAGVRFESGGQAILQLSDGTELSLEQVGTIESPLQAAQRMVGKHAVGLDRTNPSTPEVVEGQVTGVRADDHSGVTLELDTGKSLQLRDVITVTAPAT